MTITERAFEVNPLPQKRLSVEAKSNIKGNAVGYTSGSVIAPT